MERLLRERERESKEDLENRVRDLQVRYDGEIEKLRESLGKLELENSSLQQTVKQQEQERH